MRRRIVAAGVVLVGGPVGFFAGCAVTVLTGPDSIVWVMPLTIGGVVVALAAPAFTLIERRRNAGGIVSLAPSRRRS